MSRANGSPADLHVAIVGGGIAGIALALGLVARKIPFTIYERAQSCREVGAGIGFTTNAEHAMKALDQRVHDAFKAVAAQNADDWFRWVDGHTRDKNDPSSAHEELILSLYLGERGFEGCQRSSFLEEMLKHIPAESVQFDKNLEAVVDQGQDQKVVCRFTDGTTAEADIVIGCDGIRSRVRQLILGEHHPASRARYSHKYALRGLISMDKARAALGEEKTATRFMHLGPNAHALTFPVAMGKLLNVVTFVTDPGEWPHPDKLSAPVDKSKAVEAFKDFGPAVTAIINLLPDELDAWAVFDLFDNPPPTYIKGGLCIAGDAAHASAPYHGAGAGFGIEDAAVLADVLVEATTQLNTASRGAVIKAALTTYNNVRINRNQFLMQSSRLIGQLFQWQDPVAGRSYEKCAREIDWRSHAIWDYDVAKMLADTKAEFQRQLSPKPLKAILGTMTFGKADMFEGATVNAAKDVDAMLDTFQAHGHYEVDTARIYGSGSAETFLADAAWEKRKLAVGTKLYPTKGKPMSHLGPAYDFSPESLREGLKDSLKALNTSKLPLWLLYAPDRRFPLEQTLSQVDKLHKEGLFEQFGISNFMSWEVAQVCEICERHGWVKPSVYQGLYNALHRAIEPELVPCLRFYGIRLYVGQPLAGGLLTSRYRRDYPELAHPPRSRFDPKTLHGKHHRSRYWNDAYFDALDEIRGVGKRHGLGEAEMGLRWLAHHSALKAELGDGVVVGASDAKQLEDDLVYLERGPLPQDAVNALDAAWAKVKAIAPRYNH